MSIRSIPEIQIIPARAQLTLDSVLPAGKPKARTVKDLRQERIKEFLQAL